MNQTGMPGKNTLGNSRNQTPTHSATLPQNKFIMKRFGMKEFPNSIKSPLFHDQKNSKSVLDDYQKKQVDKERKSFLSGLLVETSLEG